MESLRPAAATERGRKRPIARRVRRTLDIIGWLTLMEASACYDANTSTGP